MVPKTNRGSSMKVDAITIGPDWTKRYQNVVAMERDLTETYRGDGWYKDGSGFLFMTQCEETGIITCAYYTTDPRDAMTFIATMPTFKHKP